jgi:IS5 family transposase
MGFEDGDTLRADTTVVETDIHFPTDSTFLWGSVRVITRLINSLDEQLPQGVGQFANGTRRARRRMQEIQRMTPKQRQRRQRRKYRDLIGITEEVVQNARGVLKTTSKVRTIDALKNATIQELRKQIEHYCELDDQVIHQTRRRVLEKQLVPNEQKIYSIFEPHTDLIIRGKQQEPVEFGHKVFLAESANGLITQYCVLKGNPTDEA